MGKKIKILLGVVIFFAAVIFAYFNSQKVTLYYWEDKPIPLLGYEAIKVEPSPGMDPIEKRGDARGIPLFLLIIISFVLGFATNWMLSLRDYIKVKWNLRKTNRELKKAKKDKVSYQAKPESVPTVEKAASKENKPQAP